MLETYFLNGDILPTIPVSHNCVVDDITIENQYIQDKCIEIKKILIASINTAKENMK